MQQRSSIKPAFSLIPRTLERYKEVLSHFERLLGKKKYVENISRLLRHHLRKPVTG